MFSKLNQFYIYKLDNTDKYFSLYLLIKTTAVSWQASAISTVSPTSRETTICKYGGKRVVAAEITMM